MVFFPELKKKSINPEILWREPEIRRHLNTFGSNKICKVTSYRFFECLKLGYYHTSTFR